MRNTLYTNAYHVFYKTLSVVYEARNKPTMSTRIIRRTRIERDSSIKEFIARSAVYVYRIVEFNYAHEVIKSGTFPKVSLIIFDLLNENCHAVRRQIDCSTNGKRPPGLFSRRFAVEINPLQYPRVRMNSLTFIRRISHLIIDGGIIIL